MCSCTFSINYFNASIFSYKHTVNNLQLVIQLQLYVVNCDVNNIERYTLQHITCVH